jgi:superfamily II DNA or RNA helicase
VVLATGLGKTWLAAFDHQQLHAELGAPPRLLFLAHRKELLLQAAQTYRRALHANGRRARVGWCLGEQCDLSAELVFASVAKLARPEHVAKLATERFDYVVVDEVHHAAARSYRAILGALDPRFLLGLTATPDRADAADVLGLFDDHIAYRADVERGVAIGRLVPFHYFGVKDDIDYDNIPWRNRRFDAERLAEAAQTEARMATIWRAWGEHPGARTLVFCCSVAHASFVRAWLVARGVRARAVYSGDGSDDRDDAIRALEAGAIDALCSVDVFNEGVDVPAVDRVVMLRPTESSVVFLQQLGRGLRACDGKTGVTVIDFVGNHRVFLERLRALLSLGGSDRRALRPILSSAAPIELPAGCSVELALEAKDLLARMFRGSGADEVERIYRELTDERGARPTAGELERLGYPPSLLRKQQRHASWFDFVDAEGGLVGREGAAFAASAPFLRDLEATSMTKCFKMVTLEALLEASALREGLPLRDLALRSHAILRRSPELFAEVADDVRLRELDGAAEKSWLAYWRKNPIEAWTASTKVGRAWFKVEGDRFVPAFALTADDAAAVAELTRELVDYRLAQYRGRRQREEGSSDSFVCRVLWNQRDPILKLPARARIQLPEGETDVRVDGEMWQFRLAKEFCNVARRAGSPRNQLPDLLRRWFGPSAGKPGTAFDVRFERSPDGLWAVPVDRAVVDLPARRGVVAYPELRAAAGHATGGAENVEAARVMLPTDTDDPDLFAVRVSGTSMDGGKEPMRDGDWAILRLARSAPASALEGRVVLVEVPAASFGSQYQLKRLRRQGGAWRLASDNPDGPSFEAREDTVPIARLDRVIRPEELGPAPTTILSEAELPGAFGLEEVASVSGRHGGHLFVFVDQKGVLVAPDRVRFVAEPERPSETAFVLSRRPDGALRYLGVGRWLEGERRWEIPDVDFDTWRTWGEGRETSRALPSGALARAQLVADAVLALPKEERWLEQPGGSRARVVGAAARGGLRVDGGEEGFGERTVSLTDLAWIIAADDAARDGAGLLDEALVNRVRYLDGTPKGSTRWVDTGWALAAWRLGKALVRAPGGGASDLRRMRRDDGTALDASFRVEPVGDALSVVFESRGGTRGSKEERNSEYAPGLLLLLERLRGRGLRIADAVVESRDTVAVPVEERRLALDGRAYPLVIDDADAVRRALSAAQAKVGRAPGARGPGNATKRLRLVLDGAAIGATELARLLEGPEQAAGPG